MNIVDELMTPGCPQCAVKHLSAALVYQALERAHAARCRLSGTRRPLEERVLLARAFINLGEVLIGYKSHLWFAVGLLQRSEEIALCHGSCTEAARSARLLIEEKGIDGVRAAMTIIHDGVLFSHGEMQHAHTDEARRELPTWQDFDFDDIPATIEKIRKEYFALPEATVAEGENANEKGEPEMATKKAPAVRKAAPKKADKKLVQAACKGGKTCKGKSCKK